MHEGPPSSTPVPATATAPGPGPTHAGIGATRALPTHGWLLGEALMPAMGDVLLGPMHAHAVHRAIHVASTLCRGKWRLLLGMLALGRVGVRPGTPDLALAAPAAWRPADWPARRQRAWSVLCAPHPAAACHLYCRQGPACLCAGRAPDLCPSAPGHLLSALSHAIQATLTGQTILPYQVSSS